MILFYDWQKIKKYSNRNVQIIRIILENLMNVPRKSFGRNFYDRIDFTGHSFLINPEGLLYAFQNANQVDAANYLMLASYRNFAEYKITGDLTLPLKYIKIPTEQLNKNSLIEIKDNKIHFLMEKK